MTRRERITHYHGQRGLEKKLHRLFSDFRFTSMGKLIERFKWEESSVEYIEGPITALNNEGNPVNRDQVVQMML